MPQDATEFVSAITGDAGANALFAILPDHRGSDVEPSARYGKLAELEPILERMNREGAGIFLTINQTAGRRRRKEDVTAVRALFIDSDGTAMPDTWPLAPSLICARGAPGKWHAYWLLKPGENMLRWPGAQRALATFYGTDQAVCDLPRVMRVPGFAHMKNPEAPDAYRIAVKTPGAWTLDEVLRAHGIDPAQVPAEAEKPQAEPIDPDAEPLSEDGRARLIEAMADLTKRYARNPALSRDKLIGGWIIDAVGAGMDPADIEAYAESWLLANGRAAQANEIRNWMRSARQKLTSGRAQVRTPGLRVDADFEAVGDSAPAAAAAAVPAAGETASEWMSEIPATREGTWKSHPRTVQLICTHDPRLRECFAYNAFTGEIEVNRAPWRTWTDGDRQWCDNDITAFACWVPKAFDCKPVLELGAVQAGVLLAARGRPYHPIKDYLRRQVWDKKPRLDSWLTTYFGVEATPYTAAVGAKTLMAAVRRIMTPGCKFDTVLILEGVQGAGKSRALEALASPWFSSETIVIGDKDSLLAMRRSWIHELGELDTMRRAEVNELKAFLSRATDRVRDPFQRMTVDRPRQGILIGTTNKDEYLKDETGGRRFWPVRCAGAVDVDGLTRDRDQLWAEAVVRADSGEPIWLEESTIREEAEDAQEQRHGEDPWEEEIADWLEDPTGFGGGKAESIRTVDVFKAINPTATIVDMTDAAFKRIAAVLRRLGWVRKTRRIGGRCRKVFVRAEVVDPGNR